MMDAEDRGKRRTGLILAHFIKGQFLESFLDGNLSLGHVSLYQKKGNDPAGRLDANEGIISVGSPKTVRVFVGIEKSYGEVVPFEQCKEVTGLSGPVLLRASGDSACHIFSCSAFPADFGAPDPRLFEDRDYAVFFKDARGFLDRFDNAVVATGLSGRRGLVQYIDEDTKKTEPIFFAKTKEFSYQHELRFAVFGSLGTDRLPLRLGDLRSLMEVRSLSRIIGGA